METLIGVVLASVMVGGGLLSALAAGEAHPYANEWRVKRGIAIAGIGAAIFVALFVA
jgi:hypothetical protein